MLNFSLPILPVSKHSCFCLFKVYYKYIFLENVNKQTNINLSSNRECYLWAALKNDENTHLIYVSKDVSKKHCTNANEKCQ